MNINTKLKQEVWRSDIYFQLAKRGSLDVNHPGMKILQKLSKSAKKILDLGCGEGTRLNSLLIKGLKATGVDITSEALEMGRKNYPAIDFIKYDLERIPLKSNSFDLVYSACVLEHLSHPTRMLNEAIRLMSSGGYLVLIAPNYGAPNRASPPFRGSRIKKIVKGILGDIINLFQNRKQLNWASVKPIADKTNYKIDWDTTVEPYLGSLINFLKSRGLKLERYDSCWSQELPQAKIHQRIFRKLGQSGIYPFNLWGPHLVLVVRKI